MQSIVPDETPVMNAGNGTRLERPGFTSKTPIVIKRRSLRDRLSLMLVTAHSGRILRRFLAATQRAADVQDQILQQRIRRNAHSDFGAATDSTAFGPTPTLRDRFRFRPTPIISPTSSRSRQAGLRRCSAGGSAFLMFALTSGTTDEPKFVPVTDQFLREYRRGWNAFGIKAVTDHPGSMLRPILQVVSPMDEFTLPSGVPCGAISGLMAATQKRLVRRYYVVPTELAYVTDPVARYYSIMRFAAPEDVAFSITASPATQLKLVRTAAEHSELLIRDVCDGTLANSMEVPGWIREAIRPQLRPDPANAR